MSGESKGFLYKASLLEPGYNRIVGPGDSGLKLLEFGRLSLSAGAEYKSHTEGREACLTILSGVCSVTTATAGAGESRFQSIGGRTGVFAGNPDTLYLPRGTDLYVTAGPDGLQAAIFLCPARRDTLPMCLTGSQIKRQVIGSANWRRQACITLGNDADADRLLVGETCNSPGNWSSYPPHKHDENALPEQPYEEIYFYTIDPPQGFGIQRLYTAGEDTSDAGRDPDPARSDDLARSDELAIDEVYVVENGDAVVIPRGYHPVAAAPGYQLSYLWALAGEKRTFGQWSDDPKHSWIRSLE